MVEDQRQTVAELKNGYSLVVSRMYAGIMLFKDGAYFGVNFNAISIYDKETTASMYNQAFGEIIAPSVIDNTQFYLDVVREVSEQ